MKLTKLSVRQLDLITSAFLGTTNTDKPKNYNLADYIPLSLLGTVTSEVHNYSPLDATYRFKLSGTSTIDDTKQYNIILFVDPHGFQSYVLLDTPITLSLQDTVSFDIEIRSTTTKVTVKSQYNPTQVRYFDPILTQSHQTPPYKPVSKQFSSEYQGINAKPRLGHINSHNLLSSVNHRQIILPNEAIGALYYYLVPIDGVTHLVAVFGNSTKVFNLETYRLVNIYSAGTKVYSNGTAVVSGYNTTFKPYDLNYDTITTLPNVNTLTFEDELRYLGEFQSYDTEVQRAISGCINYNSEVQSQIPLYVSYGLSLIAETSEGRVSGSKSVYITSLEGKQRISSLNLHSLNSHVDRIVKVTESMIVVYIYLNSSYKCFPITYVKDSLGGTISINRWYRLFQHTQDIFKSNIDPHWNWSCNLEDADRPNHNPWEDNVPLANGFIVGCGRVYLIKSDSDRVFNLIYY